jgi:ribosomal protein L37E
MSRPGCNTGGSGGAAGATWTPPYCTIVAADTSDFSYLSCPACGRSALPGHAEGASCAACGGPAPERVYRLLLSVATHDRVFPVILFDRAARTLLGCPADELARLFAAHRGAARVAADALQGEMCRLALRRPARDGAEHLRVVSVVPLGDGFCPVVDALRTLYSRG